MRVAPLISDGSSIGQAGTQAARTSVETGNDERKRREGVCMPREVSAGRMWLSLAWIEMQGSSILS